MRIIKKASEAYMVATFLKSEIMSSRYKDKINAIFQRDGVDRSIIEVPDITDSKQNTYRTALLKEYRDFGLNKGLFNNFPEKVEWYKALLNRSELEEVKYIDWDYWLKISGGSRLVVDAVENIKNGIEIYGLSNKIYWEIAKAFCNGKKFSEIILVSKNENDILVILEGHLRLTSYLIRPECIPQEFAVIIGYSPDMQKWDLY